MQGALVCFFRPTPRIARKWQRESRPPAFRPPALIRDSVHRLELASDEWHILQKRKSVEAKTEKDQNFLRVLTNLFTYSPLRAAASVGAKPVSDKPLLPFFPPRQSVVFVKFARDVNADRMSAFEYIFESDSLEEVCEHNGVVARRNGRLDHERIFKTLEALFPEAPCGCSQSSGYVTIRTPLAHKLVTRLLVVLLNIPLSALIVRQIL